jgi:hypothetical protein
MDEFKHKGGVLSGREERYDEFEGVPKNIGGSTTGGFGHTRDTAHEGHHTGSGHHNSGLAGTGAATSGLTGSHGTHVGTDGPIGSSEHRDGNYLPK